MKKIPFFLLSIFLVLILISACGGGGGNDSESPNERFIGDWLYVDTGKALTIDSKTDTSQMKEIDPDLLRVDAENDEHKYLLKAVDIEGIFTTEKTATVVGNVVDVQIDSAPVVPDQVTLGDIDVDDVLENEGLSGIEIVLQDINMLFDPFSTETGANGQFNFSGIDQGKYNLKGVSQDGEEVLFEYEVQVDDSFHDTGISTTVEKNDLNQYNFKSFASMKDSYVFGNYWTYDGIFEIQNIGTENAIGLNYQFDCSNEFIEDCSFSNVLGTINAGRSVQIPFEISFKFLDQTKREIRIPVQITDAFGNQWTDYGVLDVYQVPMAMNHVATRASHPVLISPENRIIRPYFYGAEKVTLVPYYPGQEYRFLFANRGSSQETPYSFGIESEANSLTGFSETQRYEPNESYESALVLGQGGAVTSYSHRGDLDYYRIDMPEENAPTQPYSFEYVGRSNFYDLRRFPSSPTLGNNDGILNPGEIAAFDVAVKNLGNSHADNLKITVTSDSPYVVVTNPYDFTVAWIRGDETVDSHQNKTNYSSYLGSRDNNLHRAQVIDSPEAVGKAVEFAVNIEDTHGNIWKDTFIEVIQ